MYAVYTHKLYDGVFTVLAPSYCMQYTLTSDLSSLALRNLLHFLREHAIQKCEVFPFHSRTGGYNLNINGIEYVHK